jgi:hypothetical protein
MSSSLELAAYLAELLENGLTLFSTIRETAGFSVRKVVFPAKSMTGRDY